MLSVYVVYKKKQLFNGHQWRNTHVRNINQQQPKNHANQPNLDPLVSTVVRECVGVGPPIIVAIKDV